MFPFSSPAFWGFESPVVSQVIFGMVGLFASCFRFPLTPVVIVSWMLLGVSMVFVEVELGKSRWVNFQKVLRSVQVSWVVK